MGSMRIGEKIKQRRIERKMSATQLGRLVGRSPTTIIEIEEGGTKDPKVSIVRAIADELQVSVDWLTDDKQGGSPASTVLEDKIVEAVHSALTPFQSFSDLTQDEALIIAAVSASSAVNRLPITPGPARRSRGRSRCATV